MTVRALASDVIRWVAPWWRYRRRLARRHRRPPHLATIAAVDGMLSNDECALLYELAQAARGGCIVEIGTYHGKGTVALALGARDGGGAHVYAIDPFVPYSGPLGRHRFGPEDKTALLRNLLLTGLAEQVWLVQTRSDDAAAGWREPIALLVIDGDHSYDGVQGDFARWDRFVVPGGALVFDDSLDPRFGVARLVREVVEAGGHQPVVVRGKMTVLRKRAAPAGYCT